MVIHELLTTAEKVIDRIDAEVLLSHILSCNKIDLLLNKQKTVTEGEQSYFLSLVNSRSKGCPVAYLIGKKEFYSLDFYVSEDVLIPRPDTETLVDEAIKKCKGKSILDICCGSGCIGITTFIEGGASSLSMCDISEKALDIARKNALRHKVNANIFKIDILNGVISNKYDIILSNPPYIETEVIKTLETDVKDFEPTLALDGGKTGLDFYPVIIKKSAAALLPSGYLFLEIGYNQGNTVAKMMQDSFKNIKITKDLAGNDRVVSGQIK